MDAVLIILLLMGACSITLALYILADAKRSYTNKGSKSERPAPILTSVHRYRERSKRDRRSGQSVTFPLRVNGELIREDRRKLGDRRRAAMA